MSSKGGATRKGFSTSPADYQLLEEVGHGASATVHRAIYVPSGEIVAVKCLDLDRCSSNLDDIRKEAQTMSLIDHPNVIKAFCSFAVDHNLWVVMPFMAEGSCLHLMKSAYPDGFEELVIGSILKETLKALEYLHRHGHIHRDVKAGNVLLDNSGEVKLGDFGVSAFMFDKGDRQRSRNTFVGTPCWMAPEILQPGSGYDFKADIWSFGITALELAHGHAPFSKYPPMKVLLMTLQNAPPGLDYERDKRFSKSFKEMVAMCLVKDQTKRPTAEMLLRHSFFKNAKPPELCVRKLFAGLPPLWDRVKDLQLKDAAQLALKKMPSAEQEALSQSEYQRGVSAWNFDIDDLKAQASLIQDDDDLSNLSGVKKDNGSRRHVFNYKDPSTSSASFVLDDSDYLEIDNHIEESEIRSFSSQNAAPSQENMDSVNQDMASAHENRLKKDSSLLKQHIEPANLKNGVGIKSRTSSGPLMLPSVLENSSSEKGRTTGCTESNNQPSVERLKHDAHKVPNLSGPLMLPTRASANSLSAPIRSSGGYGDMEDKSKPNVVQIKGRFSVTSENVDLAKVSSMKKSASVGEWVVHSKSPSGQFSKDVDDNRIHSSPIMPCLQNLYQQTSFQQELIANLLNCLQQSELVETGMISPAYNHEIDSPIEVTNSERERLLLSKVSELQARMTTLTDELITAKLKHIQLEQQLHSMLSRR